VPISSFVPINSNALTLMELRENQRELYFSFDNQFDGSDIVINVKKAKQYTTRLYLYSSYDAVKTNGEGQYIDYLEEFDLSEKLLYYKSAKKQTYYIVIKDLGDYSTKDYFSIFNEQDILELKPDEPFTIKLFLSKNLYKFNFKAEKDEVVSLDFNINNLNFGETIAILLNNEVVYKGERNKGMIKLNEEKAYGGTYEVQIKSTNDEVYTPIKSSIALYKEKNTVLKLEEEKPANVFYVNSKKFRFYVDVNDYELNEENLITFKFTHNASRNKLIEYCYAKNMNFEEFDDNKFISNMPAHEEDSEAHFSRLNTLDNVYHLYFARTQKPEENKKSYLLVHCSMKIDDDLYYDPETITVYLSKRAISLNLSDNQYLNGDFIKINQKITIEDFIPKVYRISLPYSDKKLSYVFYTNIQIQTVYEDSMIKSDYSNDELRQIYALSTEKKEKKVYVKLFGAKQEINFRLESTDSDIYYYSRISRPVQILSQQHLNCGNSFYYIGNYGNLAADSKFYLEEIYGKYNVFYKNSITDSDSDTILTNGNSQYLMDSKDGLLSKTFDIVELKCESPGYFNFHLLINYFTKTLTMYKRQVAYAPEGNIYIYPTVNEAQKHINLEVTTLLGKEVDIYTNNITKKINSDNRYFQINFKKAEDVPKSIKLNVKESNTLLSIKLSDDSLYNVVEGYRSRVNEEFILFKLNNSVEYKNVNITLKRVSHDYSYTMFRGDVSYTFNPILSGYATCPLEEQNQINLILSNPYLKLNSMVPDKENSPFYIMFYVNDPEGVQKDVYLDYTPIEKYETIPNSEIKIYSTTEGKYGLDINKDVSKVSVLYQSCGKSLKGLNIYSYDDILNSFDAKNKYNLGVFNNYLIPKQVGPIFEKDEGNQYEGAIVGISLEEISKDEIDNYNKNEYAVRQNGKVLKWNPVNNVKEYVVFVFNEKNEDLKYIQNPCFLDHIQKSYINASENETSYIAHYTTGNNYYELSENGTFITTVVANMGEKMPMKFIYKEYAYNSSAEPYDEDTDDDGDNTLLIELLVIIPILVIIIIILIVYLVRKNKQKEIHIDKDLNRKLVRDTTNSSNVSNSQEE
jgi:hypothetical protein